VDEALLEGITLNLGGFFARANSLLHQSEAKAKEHQALADELAVVKEQMANQAYRFFIQEAALKDALGVVRKAEEAANKRLHDEGQRYTTLLNKVVPLHAEIAELKDAAATSKTKMTNLEESSVTREVHLGQVEADLAAMNEGFENIKAELVEQVKLLKESQEELAKKVEVMANMEKEMAAQAERSKKVERELLDDVANAYAAGFEDALSQVICEHPEMDTSNYATANHVVKGRIVPRDLP